MASQTSGKNSGRPYPLTMAVRSVVEMLGVRRVALHSTAELEHALVRGDLREMSVNDVQRFVHEARCTSNRHILEFPQSANDDPGPESDSSRCLAKEFIICAKISAIFDSLNWSSPACVGSPSGPPDGIRSTLEIGHVPGRRKSRP